MKSFELYAIAGLMMVLVMMVPTFMKRTIVGIKYHTCLREYKTIIGLKLYHMSAMLLVQIIVSAFFEHPITGIMPIIGIIWSIYFALMYIVYVPSRVKTQQYKKELCGIYYASDEISSNKANLVTNMSNGSTSKKQLSKHLIDYFDENHDDVFEEVFGPKSFLYEKHPSYKRYWKKEFNQMPYDYTAECGLNHISHEFFILFKESKRQSKWLLEILKLFNEDYTRGFSDQKIDNLIRLLSHINEDGKEEELYTSDFLNDLTPYIIDAISQRPREEMIFYREVKECYLLNQLFKFIAYTFKKNNDKSFYDAAITLNNSLYDDKGYVGQCNFEKHESHIRKILMTYQNELTVKFAKEFDKKKFI